MINKKALIVFHRVDSDGLCSMCIAKHALEDDGYVVDLIGYNYGDNIPDLIEDRKGYSYNLLFMVDIGFSADIMLDIWKHYKRNFIWCDHHVSSIELSIENNYSDIIGLRSIDLSACELTWKFFYGDQKIPEFITLIGINDMWRKDEVSEEIWENKIIPLQFGIRSRYGVVPDKWLNDFYNMLFWENRTKELIEEGLVLKKYQDRVNKSIIKNFSFPVTVNNKYKGICVIGISFSSNIFKSVINEYDIYIICNRKDSNVYSISMYKELDRVPEFSIAGYKNFKGHKSAGGCLIDFNDFKELITECRI